MTRFAPSPGAHAAARDRQQRSRLLHALEEGANAEQDEPDFELVATRTAAELRAERQRAAEASHDVVDLTHEVVDLTDSQ